jgi:hypothetical protein
MSTVKKAPVHEAPRETVAGKFAADPIAKTVAESIQDPQAFLAQFVASDEEAANMSGKAEQVMVAITKPNPQKAFCLHPDPAHAVTVWCFLAKQDGEMGETPYLIAPELVPLVEESCRRLRLILYVCPSGTYGLLPVKMTQKADGTLYPQAESMLRIAAEFGGRWIRVKYDKDQSAYQPIPMRVVTEPVWPDEDIWAIVMKAFGTRAITSRGHPILVDQLGPA